MGCGASGTWAQAAAAPEDPLPGDSELQLWKRNAHRLSHGSHGSTGFLCTEPSPAVSAARRKFLAIKSAVSLAVRSPFVESELRKEADETKAANVQGIQDWLEGLVMPPAGRFSPTPPMFSQSPRSSVHTSYSRWFGDDEELIRAPSFDSAAAAAAEEIPQRLGDRTMIMRLQYLLKQRAATSFQANGAADAASPRSSRSGCYASHSGESTGDALSPAVSEHHCSPPLDGGLMGEVAVPEVTNPFFPRARCWTFRATDCADSSPGHGAQPEVNRRRGTVSPPVRSPPARTAAPRARVLPQLKLPHHADADAAHRLVHYDNDKHCVFSPKVAGSPSCSPNSSTAFVAPVLLERHDQQLSCGRRGIVLPSVM
eukprot:TRINITY_DN55156_c0_g1_i1.p1 TRINITY_DN55156_c0_g1~~TRINITY_DN55156_c0_g1_i1.p1  ORF type:complete len:370 (+),score=73.91 TRINITY_DN55156_c0_g1_i1:108-1217(+)